MHYFPPEFRFMLFSPSGWQVRKETVTLWRVPLCIFHTHNLHTSFPKLAAHKPDVHSPTNLPAGSLVHTKQPPPQYRNDLFSGPQIYYTTKSPGIGS